MIVKVCGMRDGDNIRQVEASGVDLMGFIFYPRSSRYVASVPDYLPGCRRVGVFVNEPVDHIVDIAGQWGLWAVQLHGDEPPGDCATLRGHGLRVIKAFGVADGTPPNIGCYEGLCDLYVFDTACKGYGGSGRQFDWSALDSYHGKTPFLLSGGLNPAALGRLGAFSHPMWAGVDLNSGFETAPGVKDAAAVAAFVRSVKGIPTCDI